MKETIKKTNKIPMNIQFFSDAADQAGDPPADQAGERGTNPQEGEKAPTVEELMAQIAQVKAENQKLQTKNNALSTEAAESKKALRAKHTAEEREAEEKAEAQRLADEEREAMRKELNHIKAVAAYKNIPNEKMVETLIEAVSESDHAAIAAIIEEVSAKAVKEARAEWQGSQKQPQFGTGEISPMTISEAMKITDREARLKTIARGRNQR